MKSASRNLSNFIRSIDGKQSLFERTYNQSKITTVSTRGLKDIPEDWIKISFKAYPRFRQYSLREPAKNLSGLKSTIHKRVSRREFSGKPLTVSTLSSLLMFSCGITYRGQNWDESKRAYPSAGARFPLEAYLILPDTGMIPAGIFHYNVKKHSLEEILRGNYLTEVSRFAGQDWIANASTLFLISAVHLRTSIKYMSRSVRHIFIEAGHLAQNIYLLSTELGLGCCAIGGFSDNKINKLLDLDQTSEAVIYMVAVGTL